MYASLGVYGDVGVDDGIWCPGGLRGAGAERGLRDQTLSLDGGLW